MVLGSKNCPPLPLTFVLLQNASPRTSWPKIYSSSSQAWFGSQLLKVAVLPVRRRNTLGYDHEISVGKKRKCEVNVNTYHHHCGSGYVWRYCSRYMNVYLVITVVVLGNIPGDIWMYIIFTVVVTVGNIHADVWTNTSPSLLSRSRLEI